eukprot:s1767_g2.t1
MVLIKLHGTLPHDHNYRHLSLPGSCFFSAAMAVLDMMRWEFMPGFPGKVMVEMGAKPVSDMALMQENLLVAHSDCIADLTLARGEESSIARLGNYRVKHLHESEVSILSVAAAVQRDLLFGGYFDGSIAVWSMQATEQVSLLGIPRPRLEERVRKKYPRLSCFKVTSVMFVSFGLRTLPGDRCCILVEVKGRPGSSTNGTLAPKLPAKTLLSSPMDQAAIFARLRILVQDLLLRWLLLTCMLTDCLGHTGSRSHWYLRSVKLEVD